MVHITHCVGFCNHEGFHYLCKCPLCHTVEKKKKKIGVLMPSTFNQAELH